MITANTHSQIDWNKVATDPSLTTTITNGHAARMRYSRFKKQMDGTAPVRRPRNNTSSASSSPQKRKRIEKNRASEDPVQIKRGSTSHMKAEGGDGEREGTVESTAEHTFSGGMGADDMARIKRERGSRTHAPQPQVESPSNMLMTPITSTSTPHYCIERSASPSPSHQGHQQSFATSNGQESQTHSFDFSTSFGLNSPTMGVSGGDGLFGEISGHGAEVYGMGGLGMPGGPFVGGMENSFDSLWDPNSSMSQSQGQSEGVMVKTEPRWEETYRH